MTLIVSLQDLWSAYDLTQRTVEQLTMFSIALTVTLTIGITLGVLFFSSFQARAAGFAALNIVEMIPDIALLILLIPLVGIGVPPTITAAVLYSLLPVARNTTAGLSGVSSDLIETARAIGMTGNEILFRVRFPLALPLVAAGVRIAVIFCMGVATLGGIIGAGGLGAPLQTGITTSNDLLILLTGGWVAVLAVTMDSIAAIITRFLSIRYGGGS